MFRHAWKSPAPSTARKSATTTSVGNRHPSRQRRCHHYGFAVAGHHGDGARSCLVLLALPPSALYVAVNIARGAKKFQPPMIAWLAVMLFAVIPIREVFPENPPTGILIDGFGVLWVLISLVTAMVIFIIAWVGQHDGERDRPKPSPMRAGEFSAPHRLRDAVWHNQRDRLILAGEEVLAGPEGRRVT